MKKITNLDELHQAATDRRSVVIPNWGGFVRPKPAAFVLNQIGCVLHRMFLSGMYLYEKPKKDPRHQRMFPPAERRLARDAAAQDSEG